MEQEAEILAVVDANENPMPKSTVADASVLINAFLFPGSTPGRVVALAEEGVYARHVSLIHPTSGRLPIGTHPFPIQNLQEILKKSSSFGS